MTSSDADDQAVVPANSIHPVNSLGSAAYLSDCPRVLIIEANETQTQPAARLLTLANFRVIVASTPQEANQRCFGDDAEQTQFPQIVVAGQVAIGERETFARLLGQLSDLRGFDIPLLSLTPLDDEQLLLADPTVSPFFHTFSQTSRQWLKRFWDVLPDTRIANVMSDYALVLDALPARGIAPRVSREKRSRNRHFRLALSAARQIIPSALWDTALADVGLGRYCTPQNWPPDDDNRLIPPEYLSCLQQAVAFSRPDDPGGQLRRWGESIAQTLLDQRSSLVARRAVRLFKEDRSISIMLRRFTAEMDAIRGEVLHIWMPWPDGSYWLVHYSNLYVYGRAGLPAPTCHSWLGALDAMLRYVRLNDTWEAEEVECSGQTHTGHCVFVLRKRARDEGMDT